MKDLRDFLAEQNLTEREAREAEARAYNERVRSGEVVIPPSDTEYRCDRCRDIGWFINAATGTSQTCTCEVARRQRSDYARRRLAQIERVAGGPHGLYRRMPDDPDVRLTLDSVRRIFSQSKSQRDAYNLALQFVETAPRVQIKHGVRVCHSLLLHGEKGYGKTLLASAIINTLEDNDIPAWGGRLSAIIERVNSMYQITRPAASAYDHYPEYTAGGVLRSFCDIDILVIDEFELHNVNNSRLELVETLINERYVAGLPTLITTNLDRRGIERKWGMRVADRMYDGYWFYHVAGEKLRSSDNEIPSGIVT